MRDLISAVLNKAPIPYAPATSGTVSTIFSEPKGAEAHLRAYGSNGTLYSIVSRLATSTAAVGWKLWNTAASGKKEDRTEVTRHLAVQLWNRPNKFFTQRLLVETEQQHGDLTGEGWIVVARNPKMRSIPLELWPVRPDRIRPVVSASEFTLGYIYTGPEGQQIPLELDDVIPLIRMPDPENPYRGLGPVQALMRTLDSQRYSEDWNRNFFRNSAEPGGIIEVEERLGDDEFNEFRNRWAESHQGVDNAHRVAILENGMKWVDRKYTMREMQFAELATIGDEKLRVAFGFPKFMLGMVDDVNRASAEASDAMFGRWLVTPRLDRIKDALNTFYLPMFGSTTANMEWDYENPVPPDAEALNAERTSKATAAKTYIDAGFTGESVVKSLDLPDSLVWEKPEPKTPPMPGTADGTPAGGTAFGRKSQPKPGAHWLNAAEEPPPDDLEQVQADWETAVAALLLMWAGITAVQQAELLAQITAAVTAGSVIGLAALTVSTAAAAGVLTAAMSGMAVTAARRMAAEAAAQGVMLPAPLSFPGIPAVAETVADLLGQGLAQAAGREALRVYTAGVPAESVAQQVGEHLAGLSDAYLKEQLGAAMTRAQNVGRLETVRDVPQTIYAASEVLDRATCFPCRQLDGTVFATWFDAWKAYGGGPYHACLGRNRCRGTVVARWNELAK